MKTIHPQHTLRIVIVVAVLGASVSILPSRALAQVCVEGLCFLDRVASGDLVLPDATLGVGVIDYDADGFMDLILGNPEGQINRLLHNVPHSDGDGRRTFEDVTRGSGLDDPEGMRRAAFGFSIADYDNDADADIYILGFERSSSTQGLLYRNDGFGTFTNVTVESGLRVAGNAPQSSSFADYDLDGDVDLLVANAAGSARSILLFRNNGDGTFTDVSALTPELGGFDAVYCTLWSDFDQDGWSDCFVLVFGRPATLLKNIDDGRGGRRFINVAEEVGFTELGFAPMGLVCGDVDNDGDVDYFASNGNRGRYYRNDGGLLTSYRPFASIFGWGNALLDADNDGDLDYYMAGSWPSPAFDKLFRNNGDGSWSDVSQVLGGIEASSRFAVRVDVNNDGREDVFTMNPGTPSQLLTLYENVSTTPGHWLKVQLFGDGVLVHRDAAGAVIRVHAGASVQMREVHIGSSTASTEDQRAHFGLGALDTVDRIEVVWPRLGDLASRTETFDGPFAAGQLVILSPRTGGVECAAIQRVRGRCRDGRNRIRASALTTLPSGTEVVFALDRERFLRAPVDANGRAAATFTRVAAGDHVLSIHGCADSGTSVTCTP